MVTRDAILEFLFCLANSDSGGCGDCVFWVKGGGVLVLKIVLDFKTFRNSAHHLKVQGSVSFVKMQGDDSCKAEEM